MSSDTPHHAPEPAAPHHAPAPPTPTPALRAEPAVLPAAPGALHRLAGDPRLGARGNAPLREAAALHLQRTVGNRAAARLLQRRAAPASTSAAGPTNPGGLPPALQAGVEALSGLSLAGVQVHYNSPRPAQLQAAAYTEGSAIELGPGQEPHLAHEAWHVVQQQQ